MTDSEVRVSGYDSEKTGMQMVTVNYKNKITTFSVQVTEETNTEEPEESNVQSISVKKLPNKTTYKTGEELDLEGGIITVKYNDGSEQDIAMTDSEVTVEGYNTFEEGVQQLTLKYGGKETSLTVKVVKDDSGEMQGDGDDKGAEYEEEQAEEKEESKPVDTGDNIVSYVIYMVVSLGVIIFATKKIKTL